MGRRRNPASARWIEPEFRCNPHLSACRLAIATYGVWIGYPDGDLTIVPYFWMASVASTQSAYALPAVGDLRNGLEQILPPQPSDPYPLRAKPTNGSYRGR